jgi:hypothetical protein
MKQTLEAQTIQVDDKVYSAQLLAENHPGLWFLSILFILLLNVVSGGDLFIKAFAGRDASEAFLSYHRKKFPHEKVSEYLVGKAIAAKAPDADKDYLELCAIIEQVLPRLMSLLTVFSHFSEVKPSLLLLIS